MKRPTPARIRFTATMLAPALAVLAASIAWSVSLIPDLPDPVATHFGSGMVADGFMSPTTSIATLSGVALTMAVMFGGLTLAGFTSGPAARVIAGSGAGTIILLGALSVSTLLPQAGLATAEGFALPTAYFAAPFIVAIVGGVVVALLVKPVAEPADDVPSAEPVAISESSRAVWFGSARASWPLAAIMGLSIPATAIPAVISHRSGETGIAVMLGVGTVAVLLVFLMFLSVRVRIDAAGIHWRLLPGFPRGTIPYEKIDAVDAIDGKPGDWGGWGWRIGPNGTAILLRGGEGLRIRRRGSGNLFISVDDAARGAALANGFLRR